MSVPRISMKTQELGRAPSLRMSMGPREVDEFGHFA